MPFKCCQQESKYKTPKYKPSRSLRLMSVQNAITKLELSVGLLKVKSNLGNYVWEVKEWNFV